MASRAREQPCSTTSVQRMAGLGFVYTWREFHRSWSLTVALGGSSQQDRGRGRRAVTADNLLTDSAPDMSGLAGLP